MFEPMSLWVTRTAPYHLLTAHRLRAMGHTALAVPVLNVRPVTPKASLRRPDAIAFTSANGVRHHQPRSSWLDVPVFAVGDHTAAAARRAGYRYVRSAGGDVGDLEELIRAILPRPAKLLHFSASEPSGDLAASLQKSGYEAERIVVYDTRPASDAELQDAFASLSIFDGIVVHSPKGAQRVADVIISFGWCGTVFCISPDCAAVLSHLPGLLLETAERPTETSLLERPQLQVRQSLPAGKRWSGITLPAFRDASMPQRRKHANDDSTELGDRDGAQNGEVPEVPTEPPPSAA